MIIPDHENIKEERICQECYGYTKGGAQVPFVASLTNPISIYLRFLGPYMAAVGKVALPTSFWPTNT
jgi:hypothetical protein